VLSTTDARIEGLYARIRVLCSGPLTPEGEVELRTLTRKLLGTIQQHADGEAFVKGEEGGD